MRHRIIFMLFIPLIFLNLTSCANPSFNGQNAYSHIARQIDFGPRIPGSANISKFQAYLSNELITAGWDVEEQIFLYQNINLKNIIAKNSPNPPDIILATHYDTRRLSDREPDIEKRKIPVPGANDGASGTAVLLEIAHIFQENNPNVWLVFFDGEDQGGLNNWDWSAGAYHFVESLAYSPDAVIVIDMIGDKDLQIYKEVNSSRPLKNKIWDLASDLGYQNIFINAEKYAIVDDHQPFLEKGIEACLIIDLDYPSWHTTEDNLQQVSAESLEIVGNVLLTFLANH